MLIMLAQQIHPAAANGNISALRKMTELHLCGRSDRQIVIDAVWTEFLHLFCLSTVTSKDRLPKGLFDRRFGRFPAGRE